VINLVFCEHFVYALTNGSSGYQFVKSPKAEKLLSEENFLKLLHIGDNITQACTIPQWFPTEDILTFSHIIPVSDEHGRKGVWNHTIMIRFYDFYNLLQPEPIFDKHFISKVDRLPKSLEPLQVEL